MHSKEDVPPAGAPWAASRVITWIAAPGLALAGLLLFGLLALHVPDAEACGAGASSCYKCHNGSRAAAPSTAKWHADHKSVDNSCVGCHKGNARLIKKELAHADMVKDPRPKAAELCATCHKTGSMAELGKSYAK